jgi:hypothetical protein
MSCLATYIITIQFTRPPGILGVCKLTAGPGMNGRSHTELDIIDQALTQ